MSVYKVPQDVEADDKLLGPFSFRQFIYLVIAAMAITLAWGLGKLFVPLAIIPLPIVILFGVLALPLKKDQPMEVYLAALLSFYLKPRKRVWQPDGIQSLVEIVAPKVVEEQLTKDLSQDEATRRLSYLATLVDSRGWAVRGLSYPDNTPNAIQADVFYEAQQAEDILDDSSRVTSSFDQMISQSNSERRKATIDMMAQAAKSPQVNTSPDPYDSLTPLPAFDMTAPKPERVSGKKLRFNPYPEAMRQSIIHPQGQLRPTVQPQEPQNTQTPSLPTIVAGAGQPEPLVQVDQSILNTSSAPIMSTPAKEPAKPGQLVVSPDIIKLANNSGLSIETISNEARRIREKEEASSEEVVIPLR